MAETLVSPGVLQRENDRSFVAPAPVEVGAAIIGPTVKGPDGIPTVVTSFGDYREKFGTTFLSGSDQYEFLTSISAQKYFAGGGQSLLVTRVTPGAFTSAESTRIQSADSADAVGSSFAVGEGTIAAAAVDGQKFSITYGSTTYTLIAADNPVPDDVPDGNTFFFSTGSYATETTTNLASEINGNATLSAFLSAIADGTTLKLSGSAVGSTYNGITFSTGSTGGGTPNRTLITLAGGDGSNSEDTTYTAFTLKTIGQGKKFNNAIGPAASNIEEYSDGSLKSGSVDDLRWEVSNVNNNQGTFTVTIRRGNDNRRNKVILEQFTNCSLDPKSDNYISKVIGDQYYSVDTTTDPSQPLVILNGDYGNRSRYIYVSNVNLQLPDYLNSDGTVGNSGANSGSLPLATSGAFYNATGDIIAGSSKDNYFEAINSTGTQGLTTSDYTQTINLLKNTDDFRFNFITAPGINYEDHSATFDALVELAEDRGDTLFIGDLVGKGSTVANVVSQTANLNTSFAGAYWPWVKARSSELGRDVWAPASTVIPEVYAYNDRVSAPWFAPAGLNRGGVNVSRAEVKLTSGMRDTLYDNRVNPIATFPRNGVVAFGQKTLQKKASALDRINVRRLLIALKNFIGDTSKNLVFEQNSINTRTRFLNAVNPYLETVQQRQGLYAFRVVMDESNNTADVIDRNQLVGQVLLQPTKTAEFIILDFTILPTGATFGE